MTGPGRSAPDQATGPPADRYPPGAAVLVFYLWAWRPGRVVSVDRRARLATAWPGVWPEPEVTVRLASDELSTRLVLVSARSPQLCPDPA